MKVAGSLLMSGLGSVGGRAPPSDPVRTPEICVCVFVSDRMCK